MPYRNNDAVAEAPINGNLSERKADANVFEQRYNIEPLPEEQWLPVTLETLPPPPPLRNVDHTKGPIVCIRVFGFAILWSEMVVMAKRLGYTHPKKQTGGHFSVWRHLMSEASPYCHRHAIVKAAGTTSMCLMLGSNKTVEDLEAAKDLEAIEAVRRIIGLGRMPEWYRVQPM